MKDLTKANPRGIVKVLRLGEKCAKAGRYQVWAQDRTGWWWCANSSATPLSHLLKCDPCKTTDMEMACFAEYGVDVPQLADYEITQDEHGDWGILHKPKNGFAPYGPNSKDQATSDLYAILAGDLKWQELNWVEYYEIVQDRNGVWGIKVGDKFAGFATDSEDIVRRAAKDFGHTHWVFTDWEKRKPLPAPEPVIQVPVKTAVEWSKNLAGPIRILNRHDYIINADSVKSVQTGLNNAIKEAGG